jgi:16S rRNA (uracil1498-N3)-methyltransferase
MADRYFVERVQADRALLTGPEAHHLLHVLRARPGDEVTLLDGTGWEYMARLERVSRSEATLAVLSRREIDRESRPPLVLAVALPKGERQRWLVEKAVELGVAELVPLETARSVARPDAGAVARLRRTVIEASKQCGRNRLMAIAEPRPWPAFLASAPGEPRLLAHPGGAPLRELIAGRNPQPTSVCGAIGPEGGFTDEEVAAGLAAGWRTVDLGPRTLRVETAALLLAALRNVCG